MATQTRYNGIVKWFDAKKGYGFIGYDDQQESDVFVHYSAIVSKGYKQLKDGDKVSFTVEHGKNNKLQAADVQKV